MIAKDQHQLKSYVERAEHLNQEKADIGENLKELFQEAKSNGFDPATLRTVIKLRSEDKDKQAVTDAQTRLAEAQRRQQQLEAGQ